jgi:hypothetical protein
MPTPPAPDTSPRILWRQAVAQAALQLREAYPVQADAIDAAEKLVFGDDLAWAEDGSCRIGSRRDPTVTYVVSDTHCTCDAFRFMPHEWCKHIFAVRLHQQAHDTPAPEGETTPPPVPRAAATSTAGLPEAPASANCHIELEGRQVQLTLRDTDERRLLSRLRTVLRKFPVPAAQLDLGLPAGTAPTSRGPETAPPEGWCPVHQVQMRQRTNDTGSWYSHQADGAWCRGKVPEARHA